MKSLVIITGANRGLGKSLRNYSREMNFDLLLLQRQQGDSVPGGSLSKEVSVIAEMANPESYLKALTSEIEKFDLDSYQRVILINNAAVIQPIAPASELGSEEVAHAIQVNLVAPLHLSQCFLALTKEFAGYRVIVNISSGAAYRPIPSWSIYCATKAGLKMFTDCLAVEAGPRDRFLSFSPGIMDTDMQANIRGSSTEKFPLVDKFKSFHEHNQLGNPDEVARGLFKFIDNYLSSERVGLSKLDWDVQEINLKTGELKS